MPKVSLIVWSKFTKPVVCETSNDREFSGDILIGESHAGKFPQSFSKRKHRSSLEELHYNSDLKEAHKYCPKASEQLTLRTHHIHRNKAPYEWDKRNNRP